MTSLELTKLQAAFATGGLTPTALMDEIVARCAAYDDKAVWIYRRPADDLMKVARDLEAIEGGATKLPLYGVPFAVKDNIDIAGVPTSAGCPAFARLPLINAPVIAALEAAGAIWIGKTNLDQFATGLNGTRSPHGAPRSVFDKDYISGGSSSGSAVAVGAGLVSFALGTDTAGSGRVPAGFNNIVGLKPTRGWLSTRGVVPACRSIDCVSIFALSAGDARKIAQIAGALDEADPYARPYRAMPLHRAAPRLGVPLQREFCGDSDYARLYEDAIARAQGAGMIVESFDYAPLAEAAQLLYGGPLIAERYAAVGAFVETHRDDVHPVVRDLILGGKAPDAAALFTAQHRLAELKRRADRLWRSFDALLLPTAPTIYRVDEMEKDPVRLNSNLGRYTNFVNLLDCAGLAVPSGFRKDGLPFGVTLIGPAFSDFDLAAYGDALHRASGAGSGAARVQCDALDDTRAPGLIDLAVVGAHLTGQPLNHELTARGGVFVRAAKTARDYRLFALAGTTPPKPGLMREAGYDGAGIELEIWRLTEAAFGAFTFGVPAPLAIGTVTLEDGTLVKGFVAEPSAFAGASDISRFGGWRAYRSALHKS